MAKTPTKGSTTNVDLGKGTKKLELEVKLEDPKKIRELESSLDKDPKTKIDDQLLGKMNIHVDNFKVKADIAEANLRTISINGTVQDKEAEPFENTKAVIVNEVSLLKLDIKKDIENMAKYDTPHTKLEIDKIAKIKQVKNLPFKIKNKLGKVKNTTQDIRRKIENTKDGLQKTLGFIDNKLNIVGGFIDKMLSAKNKVYNTITGINERITKVRSLIEALKTFTKFPERVLALINGVIDNAIGIFTDIKFFFKDNENASFKYIVPVNAGVDITALSGIDKAKVADDWTSCFIANKVLLAFNLNLLTSDVNWIEDVYSEFIDNTIDTINNCGLEDSLMVKYTQLVQNYSLDQQYYTIETTEIVQPKPLIVWVWDYYGNLDYYDLIEKINGFKDNDRIQGELKYVELK